MGGVTRVWLAVGLRHDAWVAKELHLAEVIGRCDKLPLSRQRARARVNVSAVRTLPVRGPPRIDAWKKLDGFIGFLRAESVDDPKPMV